jgi:hypothetical protein
MARIDWVEQRLQNWARWKLARGGDGELGYAAVNLHAADAGRGGYVTASIPISDVEASDTDEAVGRLYPGGLRLTVLEVYVGRGGIRDKAMRLACSEATIHARVDQAHRQLADHFLAQADKRRRERERVEATIAAGRPGSLTP